MRCTNAGGEVVRLQLILHGLLGLALLGAALHHTASCLPWLWGGAGRPRLAALHSVLVPTLGLAAFVLGLWLYPTYKSEVRLGVLEVPRAAGGLGMPWVAQLFDLKEHLAALALPAALGLGILAHRLGPAGTRERPGLTVGLSVFVSLAIAVTVVIGMYVVSVRAVS
jgi:hypothetical protein